MSEDYVHDDSKIFYVIKKVSGNFNESFDFKTLEEVILKLGQNNFVLTNIVELYEGLRTPYLKYILQTYKMYNIIDGRYFLKVTDEGGKYIDEKITGLNPTFTNKADRIVRRTVNMRKVKLFLNQILFPLKEKDMELKLTALD